jgi:asparagine synthase (glutamine-hydrolysing)
VIVTEDVMASKFEDTVWHSEIPMPDTNGMGRLAMAEVARSHGIKVVFTGSSSSKYLSST